MLLFRSEDHIDAWCRQWKLERGAELSLDQAWRLARAWYGPDRRDPSWRRKTVEETEALLSQLGLTSPFWRLR
jgi:Alkylmercury lyase